jgi:hypothetical protein
VLRQSIALHLQARCVSPDFIDDACREITFQETNVFGIGQDLAIENHSRCADVATRSGEASLDPA